MKSMFTLQKSLLAKIIAINYIIVVLALLRASIGNPLLSPQSDFKYSATMWSQLLGSFVYILILFILPLMICRVFIKSTNQSQRARAGRIAIFVAGFAIIPFDVYSAELIRFTELSSECDACGDAGLALIFVIPFVWISMLLTGLIAFAISLWAINSRVNKK
jgi:hypothetical protein